MISAYSRLLRSRSQRLFLVGICLIFFGLFVTQSARADCTATIGAQTADRQPPTAAEASAMHLPEAEVLRLAGSTGVARALPAVDRQSQSIGIHIFPGSCWQVTYYSPGNVPEAKVTINDLNAHVDEAWDNTQVFWYLARGDSNSYGGELNAVIVFIPLCIAFFFAFFDWRRPWRIAHLDLFALELFAIGHGFFNAANVPWSVVFNYIALAYIVVRCSWIAIRGPSSWLSPQWSTPVLFAVVTAVLGFRIGLNITSHSVLDVGTASVAGANQILHGRLLYGHFPSSISTGDTYGPLVYLAYVPFVWLSHWNEISEVPTAAHTAAIFWDLLTVFLLAWIGWHWSAASRMVRQRRSLALVAAWVLNPYSAFTLVLSTHDTLIGAALLASVGLRQAYLRGFALGFAGGAKLLPWLLAPILGQWPKARQVLQWWAGAATMIIAALIIIIPNGFHNFYERTFKIQAIRQSPFTPWGVWTFLHPMHDVLIVIALLLTAFFAWRAPRLSRIQLIAATTAVVVASQMALNFWFYTYVSWFLPILMLTLLSPGPLFDEQPVEKTIQRTAEKPTQKRQLLTERSLASPARYCGLAFLVVLGLTIYLWCFGYQDQQVSIVGESLLAALTLLTLWQCRRLPGQPGWLFDALRASSVVASGVMAAIILIYVQPVTQTASKFCYSACLLHQPTSGAIWILAVNGCLLLLISYYSWSRQQAAKPSNEPAEQLSTAT